MISSQSKIVITGAAGFIASCMASFLNKNHFHQLILIDDFSKIEKIKNHEHVICLKKVERDTIDIFLAEEQSIDAIIHFGARTDTTEMNYAILEKLNIDFSKKIWHYATAKNIPLIYASSAATYGNGDFGYNDNEHDIEKLKPLNPYGISKNEFDKWALLQSHKPEHWYGLKFFNVYGPNEYHKKRMASIILHAFHQIKNNGSITLFKSHHPNYKDGEQLRDFIYVQDIINITFWLLNNSPTSGIYNAGSGKSNTFLQLASYIFELLQLPIRIDYVDTPLDIRDKYQYFTEANMDKLKKAGYTTPLHTLKEGLEEYVNQYLKQNEKVY